jgi:hypothetical protein
MSLPFFITEGVNIDDTTVSVTSSELGLLSGSQKNTVVANKAVIYGDGGEIEGTKINNLRIKGYDNTSLIITNSALPPNLKYDVNNEDVDNASLNLGIGSQSLNSITHGDNNVCIGHNSGDNITTGKENVYIGNNAKPTATATANENEIVIGYNATGQGDNFAVIGNGDITHVYMNHDGDAVIYYSANQPPSDRRIKSNIVDIDDSSALQHVRDIPCRYYNYIDTARRGTAQTPGFIAQEVEAVFPLAVSTDTNYIPNEYRLLTNYTLTETTTLIDTNNTTKGNYWKLTINDLTDLSTTNRYRIKVSNDTTFDLNNGKNKSKYITAIDGEQTSFLLEEKWTHIFLYGKEVSDFKRIDKAKIFTLHHSAIQQIDKTLTEEQAKIAILEGELANEKVKTVTLQTELAAIKTHLGL